MVRELMVRAVKRHGGDEKLADRLLLYGDQTYFTWVVRSIVDPHNPYNSLYVLNEVFNIPLTKLRYAYFSARSTPVGELRKLPEYKEVMGILNDTDAPHSLWESLQKYCFIQLKCICVEELVAKDETVLAIMDKIKASNGFVYRVRRQCIIRELAERRNV